MNSIERKEEIYKILLARTEPISATVLAETFGVTRQIIVKDMGVLKAEKKNIISMSKGYCLKEKDAKLSMKINVCHEAEDIETELNIIVDLGGKVVSTAVNHPVYGEIGEKLSIKSRKDVKNFLEQIKKTEPLLRLTKGQHSHEIEADDEDTLKEICEALKEKGYLLLE